MEADWRLGLLPGTLHWPGWTAGGWHTCNSSQNLSDANIQCCVPQCIATPQIWTERKNQILRENQDLCEENLPNASGSLRQQSNEPIKMQGLVFAFQKWQNIRRWWNQVRATQHEHNSQAHPRNRSTCAPGFPDLSEGDFCHSQRVIRNGPGDPDVHFEPAPSG